MAKVKTQFTDEDVYDFIDQLDNEQKKQDSIELRSYGRKGQNVRTNNYWVWTISL